MLNLLNISKVYFTIYFLRELNILSSDLPGLLMNILIRPDNAFFVKLIQLDPNFYKSFGSAKVDH